MTETGSACVYDGWPLDGVEVRVAATGELEVRGPMLLRAYRDGTDPKDADGWFATADAGSVGPDGRVVVHGRVDDAIVTGGEKVWPIPVERVLGRLPGIAEVAVVGRPDPEWGQRVVAVVVPVDRRRRAVAGRAPRRRARPAPRLRRSPRPRAGRGPAPDPARQGRPPRPEVGRTAQSSGPDCPCSHRSLMSKEGRQPIHMSGLRPVRGIARSTRVGQL